jgi:hypothetical protein
MMARARALAPQTQMMHFNAATTTGYGRVQQGNVNKSYGRSDGREESQGDGGSADGPSRTLDESRGCMRYVLYHIWQASFFCINYVQDTTPPAHEVNISSVQMPFYTLWSECNP